MIVARNSTDDFPYHPAPTPTPSLSTTRYPKYFTSRRGVYVEDRVDQWLWRYLPPFLIVLGTVGNIVSITVLRRKPLRSVSFFLTALAFADTLVLYVGFCHDWIYTISDEKLSIRNTSVVLCRIQRFLLGSAKWMSAWILVAITLQRALSVWLPIRSRWLCKGLTKSAILFTMLLCSCGFNLHVFWTYKSSSQIVRNRTRTDHCSQAERFFLLGVWPWIDSICAAFIPCAILLISNLTIIAKLQSCRLCRRMESSQDRSNGATSAMLLAVSFTFLILSFHVVLGRFIVPIWVTQTDPRRIAQLRLVYRTSTLLHYTNYAVNFLLYSVSGATFRQELYSTFREIARRKPREEVYTVPLQPVLDPET